MIFGRGTRRTSAGRSTAAAAALALVLAGAACDPQPTTLPPTPHNTGVSIWALGDSQGAESTDPARGLPWTDRLGSDVGNGATNMEGSGFTVPGTFTGRTIPQRASDIAGTNSVSRYIVMAGINDIGAGKSLSDIRNGIAVLDSFAAAHTVSVTYVLLIPFTQGSYIAPKNADRLALNAALVNDHPGHVIDCESALAVNGWLNPAYALSATNFHLNSAGEQALANCINAHR
ncbi:MAG: SGNH/GDSL hydrolase family protein [Acidimicrobiales bacterium]